MCFSKDIWCAWRWCRVLHFVLAKLMLKKGESFWSVWQSRWQQNEGAWLTEPTNYRKRYWKYPLQPWWLLAFEVKTNKIARFNVCKILQIVVRDMGIQWVTTNLFEAELRAKKVLFYVWCTQRRYILRAFFQ